MRSGPPQRIPKWVLVADLFCAGEFESALSYSFSGVYFKLARGSSVRAGSVIFLVGVGSLVCWKIWDYWNSGEEVDPPTSPSSKPPSARKPLKTPTKTSKTFFASFLEEEFVNDFDDFEDEDPALIQKLIDLARIYIKKIIAGKYFGPENPVENALRRENKPEEKKLTLRYRENASPIASEYGVKSPSESDKQYLADNSASYSADDDEGSMTSDIDENSLPFDGFSDSAPKATRKVKRKHHRSERNHLPIHSKNLYAKTSGEIQPELKNSSFLSKRFHPYDRNVNSCDDFSSSETSPIGRPNRHEMAKILRQSRLSSFQRRCELEMENRDFDEIRIKKNLQVDLSSTPPLYENYNSDEDLLSSGRQQPDGEEDITKRSRKSLSRDISLIDLMGRLRSRGSQRSLSRDNSVSSRLSDFLRREDSICSNLSEFANSECSELSLDLSLKDESIANQTITSFADIEDELNTLKSSVLEMDEEFIKFASKPNPYLLKTTFSDYSMESSDSRPHSALDAINTKTRAHLKSTLNEDVGNQRLETFSLDTSDELSSTFPSLVEKTTDGGANIGPRVMLSKAYERAEEVDSFQVEKGFSKNRFHLQRRSSIEATLKDELMPSLEWDNSGCLKQYEEQEILAQLGDESQLERLKFLPDHSSVELDLERELQSPTDTMPTFSGREILASPLNPPVELSPLSPLTSQSVDPSLSFCKPFPEFSFSNSLNSQSKKPSLRESFSSAPLSLEKTSEMICNPMTTSVDSAIGLHSAPGSRSGSSSPVSHLLTQSMMSSGIGTSWSEISTTTPDSESGNACKLRRFWGSDESGYIEGDNGLESSVTNLSPVHEIREKEAVDQSNFTSDNLDCLTTNEENQDEEHEINGNGPFNSNNNNRIMGNTNSQESDITTNVNRSASSVQAVGEKLDILNYAFEEWQGTTIKAQTMRKGYNAIPEELNLQHLQKIRGDNYCGIRAVLYQILSSSLPVPNGYQVFNRLVSEVNKGSFWLKDYSFGKRLTYSRDQVINGFKDCLEALDKINLELAGCENRECVLLSRLNNDPRLDVQLCEAAKLHMLVCALDLYKQEVEGRHIPLFAMIMFARQSCLNPRDFLINHLNPVGDSAGLEQIEMFLLGHALQVTIQVVRPSSFGNEDFICFYPDANIGVWPEVNLIAEDDRHYNVLVK